MEDILPGKWTACWSCSGKTTMDSRTMAMDKPLCESCDPNAIGVESDPELVEKLKELGIIGKLE
jgi:hypothetical protein